MNITKAPLYERELFCLRFLLYKTVDVGMELHFWVGTVFTQFLVYKRTDEDDICKDIKPEHQYNDGSKRTVDCGIFDRGTDEPGEKSADNGEKNGTDCRTGKNTYFKRASPRVAKINCI